MQSSLNIALFIEHALRVLIVFGFCIGFVVRYMYLF